MEVTSIASFQLHLSLHLSPQLRLKVNCYWFWLFLILKLLQTYFPTASVIILCLFDIILINSSLSSRLSISGISVFILVISSILSFVYSEHFQQEVLFRFYIIILAVQAFSIIYRCFWLAISPGFNCKVMRANSKSDQGKCMVYVQSVNDIWLRFKFIFE